MQVIEIEEFYTFIRLQQKEYHSTAFTCNHQHSKYDKIRNTSNTKSILQISDCNKCCKFGVFFLLDTVLSRASVSRAAWAATRHGARDPLVRP